MNASVNTATCTIVVTNSPNRNQARGATAANANVKARTEAAPRMRSAARSKRTNTSAQAKAANVSWGPYGASARTWWTPSTLLAPSVAVPAKSASGIQSCLPRVKKRRSWSQPISVR